MNRVRVQGILLAFLDRHVEWRSGRREHSGYEIRVLVLDISKALQFGRMDYAWKWLKVLLHNNATTARIHALVFLGEMQELFRERLVDILGQDGDGRDVVRWSDVHNFWLHLLSIPHEKGEELLDDGLALFRRVRRAPAVLDLDIGDHGPLLEHDQTEFGALPVYWKQESYLHPLRWHELSKQGDSWPLLGNLGVLGLLQDALGNGRPGTVWPSVAWSALNVMTALAQLRGAPGVISWGNERGAVRFEIYISGWADDSSVESD